MERSGFLSAPRFASWLIVLVMGIGAVVAITAAPWSPLGGDEAAAKKRSLPPYTVRQIGSNTVNQIHSASASCDDGDRATGGGFEGVDFSTTRIIDNSPFDSINNSGLADTWTVDYATGPTADAVGAIVVCQDRAPKHS